MSFEPDYRHNAILLPHTTILAFQKSNPITGKLLILIYGNRETGKITAWNE